MTSHIEQIDDRISRSIWPIWAFLACWFFLVTIALWIAVNQASPHKAPPYWFFAIFYAGGVFFASIAAYAKIVAHRFGQSTFDLQAPLCVPGGVVAGTIRISKPLVYRDPIHLRLACCHTEVFAGNPRQSVESAVWEDICTLDRFSPGASVGEIPVFFRLPPDCLPSGDPNISGWKLSVKAKTAGVNYAAEFRVPVLPGLVPVAANHLADPTAALRSPEPPRRQLMDRHFHLTALPGGGCQCELAAARAMGRLAMFAIIGVVFTGIGIFIATEAAPGWGNVPNIVCSILSIAFGAVFAAIGGIVALMGIGSILDHVTIIARRGVLTVKDTIILFSRQRELRAADIVDFKISIDSQVGASNTTYSISAIRTVGEPMTLCGFISNKRDAEWLAAEFKKDLLGK